jgi:hypothetical protein
MTTLRRQRPRLCAGLIWFVLSAVPTALPWQAGHASTTEQIVTDHHSGLAIYGYDPVAYFTDRAAKTGRADLEVTHAGVPWRFRNVGNREAFARDPAIYMPQYGGHDPVAIARKVARAGHPDFWAIHNDRLFLFYSEDARTAFRADPDHILLEAETNWPEVIRMLAP